MPGSASGSSTLRMICNGVAPMARAASIRPDSTSRIAFSTRRAMKGTVAIVSGTIAAVVPIDVPATIRVKGMIATTRMMNGTDRVALTTSPSTLLTHGADSSSPRCEVARNNPKGRPSSVPSSAEMATI